MKNRGGKGKQTQVGETLCLTSQKEGKVKQRIKVTDTTVVSRSTDVF